MRPLSAGDVLRVWERGERLHALDRALLLLQCARPESDWEELAALPLGRRDAWLLALRAETFGPRLEVALACPACREALEWSVDLGQLVPQGAPPAREGELLADGLRVRFRAPDSFDLAAAAQCRDVSAARRTLVERCLSASAADGSFSAASELPESVLDQVGRAMAEADPVAEILFDVRCPACGHAWQALFDPADCLWRELSPQARRLLMEVDSLARAYHWREADILALSSRRRQAYLELLGT
jgi:hypothetical protein